MTDHVGPPGPGAHLTLIVRGRAALSSPRQTSSLVHSAGMDDCNACALVARRDAGEAPPWDRILRTDHWDLVHAFGTSLEGWLVLVTRQHRDAVADLTEAEAAELGPLLQRVSAALHDVVGCAKTYVVQLAEQEGHRHVHVHIVPRASDLPHEHRGPRVFELMGVPEEQWVPEARRDELAALIAPRLA